MNINSYVEDDFIDLVVVNNKEIPQDIQDRYLEEKAKPIEVDYNTLNDMGIEVIEDELLEIDNLMVRHNPYRTALAIFNYIVKELEQ